MRRQLLLLKTYELGGRGKGRGRGGGKIGGGAVRVAFLSGLVELLWGPRFFLEEQTDAENSPKNHAIRGVRGLPDSSC